MQAFIKEGKLVCVYDLLPQGTLSKTSKKPMLVSTGGFVQTQLADGSVIAVSTNVIIKSEATAKVSA